MLDIDEKAALVQMRVGQHLPVGQNRRGRDARALQRPGDLILLELLAPGADGVVDRVVIRPASIQVS